MTLKNAQIFGGAEGKKVKMIEGCVLILILLILNRFAIAFDRG